jgi:hypothetical protein
MPRIQIDPGFLDCPDYASAVYAAARIPFINQDTTEEQAIQLLKDIWTAGNNADKAAWQLQNEQDEVLRTEQLRIQSEADDLRAQAEVEEAEALSQVYPHPG